MCIYWFEILFTHTFANNRQLAITAKDGERVRWYLDGEFQNDPATAVTLDDTDTTDLTIGNNNEHTEVLGYELTKVYIGNKALTDYEIRALYDQIDRYGDESLMGKNYSTQTDTGSGAIATSISVASDFDVPLITIKLSAAPTSAGSITVSFDAQTGANYDTELKSVSPVGSTSIFIEDLKGFEEGDAVKVEYSNPDGVTWYLTANIEQ